MRDLFRTELIRLSGEGGEEVLGAVAINENLNERLKIHPGVIVLIFTQPY